MSAACKGSARCSVPGCSCGCRKASRHRFVVCRCCERLFSPYEREFLGTGSADTKEAAFAVSRAYARLGYAGYRATCVEILHAAAAEKAQVNA